MKIVSLIVRLLKMSFVPILLLLVAVISHLEWFDLKSILLKGDWGYWFTEYVSVTPNFFSTWIGHNNYGSPNVQVYFITFFYPWSLLSSLGLTVEQASKLNMFIPIATLGFLTPYFLVKKLTRDNFISFVCALFYGSNTYFLSLQTGHLPIAFVYSITPLIFLVFITALEKPNLRNWVLFSLAYSLGIGYELRIMYIVSFMLLFYFFFFHLKNIKKYILLMLFSGIVILLLNLYWMLPTLFGGISGSIGEIANRGLFGGSLTDVLRAMTLSNWSWTGSVPDRAFNPQPIMLYFWILPLFVFLVFIFNKQKNLKQLTFYLLLLIIGIFFAKQSSPPIQEAYKFMYDYFPGFRLFRESSKFYLIPAFAYLGLLAYGLQFFKEKSSLLFKLLALVFIVTFFFNLRPLITQEYKTLFVERRMPDEYRQLSSKIAADDVDYRVLWVPRNSQWAFFSNRNPRVSMMSSISGEWKKYVSNDIDITGGQRAISFFQNRSSETLLDAHSIRYVVVPIEDKDSLEVNLFMNYGEKRQTYIDVLDQTAYLERVNLETGDVVVYENADYKPRVYLTTRQEAFDTKAGYLPVDYEIISPVEVKVRLTNIANPMVLNFAERYHRGWGMRIGNFDWKGALLKGDYLVAKEIHQKNIFNLNSFFINPSNLCSLYNCVTNQDGSYDIELTLFYRPEAFFYGGTVLSASALGIILLYLLISYVNTHIYKKG